MRIIEILKKCDSECDSHWEWLYGISSWQQVHGSKQQEWVKFTLYIKIKPCPEHER